MTKTRSFAGIVTALCVAGPAFAASSADTARTIRGFATELYIDHHPKQAFDTYAEPGMIQHNPASSDGRNAAIALTTPLFTAPGAHFAIAHLIVDGDLAFIHFHGNLGHPGNAVAELYRVQNGHLAEHWDAFQMVPAATANTHPMFGPIADGVPPAATGASAADRKLIADFADMFYRQRDVAGAFNRFMSPGYIQHNPNIADGPQAAITALTPIFTKPGEHFDVRHILVGGGFAVIHVHAQAAPNTPGAAVFDIFRLDHGKIVEHWDVLQPLPAKAANPRPPV